MDSSAENFSFPFILADEIDLLNVSFDGQFAPDRISAKAGVKELERIAPFRRYRINFLLQVYCCVYVVISPKMLI